MNTPFAFPADLDEDVLSRFVTNDCAVAAMITGDSKIGSLSRLRQIDSDALLFVCPLRGHLTYEYDFVKGILKAGEGITLQPRQAYRVIEMTHDCKCTVVGIATSSMTPRIKKSLGIQSVFNTKFPIDSNRLEELSHIFELLVRRLSSKNDSDFNQTAKVLAVMFAYILMEAVEDFFLTDLSYNVRQVVPVVVELHDLFGKHISKSRQPEYYAKLMGITTSRLNFIVKAVTGMTSSEFISGAANKIIKRHLAFSDCSVAEIARDFGYDPAYLTRVFTKMNQETPSEFRKRYIRP